MTRHLTFDEVYAQALETIGRQPERVHDRCIHFESETGKPVCAVGHILADLGLTIEDVSYPHPTLEGSQLIAQSVVELDENVDGVQLDDQAFTFLTQLQWEADRNPEGKFLDGGTPWGEALARAQEVLDLPRPEPQTLAPAGIESTAALAG